MTTLSILVAPDITNKENIFKTPYRTFLGIVKQMEKCPSCHNTSRAQTRPDRRQVAWGWAGA